MQAQPVVKLVYLTVSLGGYIEDEHGAFKIYEPDGDVFSHDRPAEVLQYVPLRTAPLQVDFDPDAVQQLKATATGDLSTGGANLAARAFASGLIDECRLFV